MLSAPILAQTDATRLQALIDQDQPARVLELLGGKSKLSAAELAYRGMARIMLGEIKAGAADLESALALDPKQRQALLNLGGLEIAEGNYAKAYDLFKRARDLEPQAADGYLNVGAVLMMMGKKLEAKDQLDRYLKLDSSAEAHFLVATNYALGGAEHLAIAELGKAIAKDEHMRLRARRDDRFLALDSLEYRVLLNTDAYQVPPGHRQAKATFRQRYDQTDGRLLRATTDALRQVGLRYEPEIEATARWALLWGDVRVKISSEAEGAGEIFLSASEERYSEELWQKKSQELFRTLQKILGESG